MRKRKEVAGLASAHVNSSGLGGLSPASGKFNCICCFVGNFYLRRLIDERGLSNTGQKGNPEKTGTRAILHLLGGHGVPDPFTGDLCKILKSVFLQQMYD